MEIKFDVYFKKNLGTLCKDNEVDLDGKEAHVNLDLNLVERLEANYIVGTTKYTDEVTIKDVENKEILIPFKSDVVKTGLNEFEIVAYMKNGDIKVSQTYTYKIEKGIGEGSQAGSGGVGDGHTHLNLTILNSITQAKVDEWDNKSDKEHTHDEYANKNDVYSIAQTDNKIREEISKIELKEGPKGDKGEQGQDGLTTNIVVNGTTYTHSNGTITLPNYPTVPTNISAFTNDSNYASETYVNNKIAEASLSGGDVDLSGYATLDDIPTNTSQLTNDSGFITSIPSEYITETELNAKGYLTKHQDISGKVDKVDGKGLSTNDLTNILKTNYDTAYTHSQSAHAPSNAQRNSDITKEEIEAKLIGEITTHSHPNSSVVSSEFKKVIETTFGEECYAFTVTQDKDGNPIQLKEGIIRITTAQPLETSTNLTYAVGFVNWSASYNGKCAIYMLNAMKNYEFYANSIYFKVINQRVLAINLGQVRCGTNKPTIGYNENVSSGKNCGMTSFRLIDKDYIDRITVGFDMATTGLFSKDSLLEVWGI